MNKNKIIFFLIFTLLFSLNLSSCGKKDSSKTTIKAEKQEKIISKYEKITKKIKEDKLDTMRENISPDDISLMQIDAYTGSKNPLSDLGNTFISSLKNSEEDKLTDNKNGGISVQTLEKELGEIPENFKRKFELELDIYDFTTKEKISSGTVYVNGVNLGSFEKGKATKKFEWLKGIESFDILIRSDNYGDAMLHLNSLNSEGKLLIGEVAMKKAIIEEKEIGKTQEIKIPGVSIKLNECSLVTKSGDCYKGKAQVKINFVSGKEANEGQVSLNRKALTKEGKIVYLQSGGMAFVDFINSDGDFLKLKNGEKIEISYKINDEDIQNMEQKKYGNGEKNGYWWYDKNSSLWKEENAKISLDIKNKTWTAKVSHLY
ncbi:hypothetical protein HGA92_05350 [Candidatus Gracilibacteria bacterium]|nr:hypothetical protein [Candidatus Gracilibacteria bacterium]NUJ99058.1 hypothetical protein [Candidatus Gracilibacteria bacterium]